MGEEVQRGEANVLGWHAIPDVNDMPNSRGPKRGAVSPLFPTNG
jgi:hypothetical protein